MIGRLQRLWRHYAPYLRRFGAIDGFRVASAIADVKWRKPAGTRVVVRVPGWSRAVELRAATSDYEVFHQLMVARELDVPLSSTPQRIIDGGANIGLATLVFARRWPAASIVAIELEQGNFEAAQRNCADLSSVAVRHAALWGSSGRVAVADPAAESHSFRAAESEAVESVRAYRLGELLDELGWDTVDFVKLDIEGAERSVLQDAAHWLPRVQHLLVELHDRWVPGCTEALEAAVAGGAWELRPQGEYLLVSRRSG